ncbi:MAG: hypothetical protein QXG00_02485 [Candidatus Woesearchaeota archaeon]
MKIFKWFLCFYNRGELEIYECDELELKVLQTLIVSIKSYESIESSSDSN